LEGSEAPLETESAEGESGDKTDRDEALKTRVEDLNVSPRAIKALVAAGIRTVGGLARKKEEDLAEVEGLGDKAIAEIKDALSNLGISLK
jgi:DNA-directed RNA polymerase subunit alpha